MITKLLFFSVIFEFLTRVTCPVNYNKTESTMCTEIKPSLPKDCYKTSYSTLMCCYLEMSTPDQGKICVPMSTASEGKGGPVSVSLPKSINITGSYDCNKVQPTSSSNYLFLSHTIFFILSFIVLI